MYPTQKLIRDLEVGDVIEGKVVVTAPPREPLHTSEESRQEFMKEREADAPEQGPVPDGAAMIEFDMLGQGADMHALGFDMDDVEVTGHVTGDLASASGEFLGTTAAMCLKILNERTNRKGGSLVLVFGDIQVDAFIEGVDEDVQMQVNVKSEGVVLDFTDAARAILSRSLLLQEAAAALAHEANTRSQTLQDAGDPLLGIKGPKL